MSCWKIAVIGILFFISGAKAGSELIEPLIEPISPKLVIKAPLTEDRNALITVTERTTTSPQQIADLINAAENRSSDILISTDQESVIEAAVRAAAKPNDKRLLRIIPLGKLASALAALRDGSLDLIELA